MDISFYSDGERTNAEVLNRPLVEIKTKIESMDAQQKSDFLALAEKRIRYNTCSGFSEMGLIRDPAAGYVTINEGMYAGDPNNPRPNVLMGHLDDTDGRGTSRTPYPIADVNGVPHNLSYIGKSALSDIYNEFPLPPAPDGTKTYDSATGIVTTHATSNEAFEGLVTNGDFRNAGTGWNEDAGATVVYTGGVASITNNAGTPGIDIWQNAATDIGVVYRVDVVARNVTGTGTILVTGLGTNPTVSVTMDSTNFKKYTFEITNTDSAATIFARVGATLNDEIEVASVSLMPATEKVITTRQDFGMLESFHEKISDKDVVYPLGNVQYGASTWEGVTLSNVLVAQGYSSFGEWDTTTTGHGVTWSTLSEADKAKFLQDPENNIYNDDGELIQVRYRIRVIEGVRDTWVGATGGDGVNFAGWESNLTPDLVTYVKPKGNRTSITADLALPDDNETGLFQGVDALLVQSFGLQRGGFLATYNFGSYPNDPDTNIAHEGRCIAIPIALVQRLNQGAYHPDFNAEGCTGIWNADDLFGANPWYVTGIKSINSTSDCFNLSGAPTTGKCIGFQGSIGTTSYRPTNDPFQFYDAIYAGQVKDLRLSTHQKTADELNLEYGRKGKAGDIRGWESVPFTKVAFALDDGVTQAIDATRVLVNVDLMFGISGDDRLKISSMAIELTDGSYGVVQLDPSTVRYVDSRFILGNINTATVLGSTVGSGILVSSTHDRTSQYETLPYQSIFSTNAVFDATFPNGVIGTKESTIPDGVIDSFPVLGRKIEGTPTALRSTDNGVTWTAFTPTFNAVTNTFTFTDEPAANIILVQYETPAKPYELANNSEVLSGLSDVFATAAYNIGDKLLSALLGKVPTSVAFPSVQEGYHLSEYLTIPDTGKLADFTGYFPTHDTITLGASTAPTGKAFSIITQENQQFYLQWVYKELIWGGADFGDNNKFDIIDGESTVTDLNGNFPIVGQQKVALPFMTGRSS